MDVVWDHQLGGLSCSAVTGYYSIRIIVKPVSLSSPQIVPFFTLPKDDLGITVQGKLFHWRIHGKVGDEIQDVYVFYQSQISL